MEPKKLRRSYKDTIIGGVAGGLGEYFTTDPLIFRILFIVLLFTGGGSFRKMYPKNLLRPKKFVLKKAMEA